MISTTIARFPWTLGGISFLAWTYTRATANNSKLLWQALAPWQSQIFPPEITMATWLSLGISGSPPREGMPCNMQLWISLGGGHKFDLSKFGLSRPAMNLNRKNGKLWNFFITSTYHNLGRPCDILKGPWGKSPQGIRMLILLAFVISKDYSQIFWNQLTPTGSPGWCPSLRCMARRLGCWGNM